MTRSARLGRLRGIYGIVDDGPGFRLAPTAWARALAEGGCTVMQLRFKRTAMGLALEAARRIRRELPGVVLLVDDRVDLALLSGADGVHLGENDLPIRVAREMLGPELLVGATVRNPEDARARVAEGADHLGAGPVFPSPTKPSSLTPLGLEGLSAICRSVPSTPVVGISGIKAENIAGIARAGAHAAAVISAVGGASDPALASRRLAARFTEGAA